MTLKQPAAVGILETNQTLSYEEAAQAIQSGKLPVGLIQTLLEKTMSIFQPSSISALYQQTG